MADHLYRDTIAVCGADSSCFVRHDGTLGPFVGEATLTLLHVVTGATTTLATVPVSLPRGGGSITWFCASGAGVPGACTPYSALLTTAGCASAGTDCLLTVSVADATSGVTVDSHAVLLAVPSKLSLQRANVSITLGDVAPNGASASLTVESDAVALFVMLTTLAQGRFSTNAFVVTPSRPVHLDFIAIGSDTVDVETLRDTLAYEYVNKYVHV